MAAPAASAAAAAIAPTTYHVLGAGAMGCLLAALLARSSSSRSRAAATNRRPPIRVALLTRPTGQQQRSSPPQQSQEGVIRVVESYRTASSPAEMGPGAEAAPPQPAAFFEASVAVEENHPGWTATEGALPPIERLMVLTKAYDALPALVDLAPRLSRDAVVVLLPNGMGHYEEIRAEPRLRHVTRWLLGTTTHGALLLPPPSPPSSAGLSTAAIAPTTSSNPLPSPNHYHVSHTGKGETYIGLPPLASVASPLESLAALQIILDELPPESHAALGLAPAAPSSSTTTTHDHHDDRAAALASAEGMQRRLWMKLAANSCINPLTALVRKRNGVVCGDPSLRPLVSALCAEAAAVANAACSSCKPPPEQGSHHDNGGKGEAADASTKQEGKSSSSTLVLDTAEAEAYVLHVARQTAGNASSMLKDVLQGRRTEIGYINGFIVREAQRLNREQQQQVGQQLGGVEGQEGGQQQQQQQQQQQGKALLRVPTHEMLLRLIRAAEGGVGGCTNV